MDGVYAFPEDMLRDSQRLHARQRLLGFDPIRSNPHICGYNLTGMLDHGMTGEGLWTFWREWKPGIVDALSDGWAPLRWCLFAEPVARLCGPAGQARGGAGQRGCAAARRLPGACADHRARAAWSGTAPPDGAHPAPAPNGPGRPAGGAGAVRGGHAGRAARRLRVRRQVGAAAARRQAGGCKFRLSDPPDQGGRGRRAVAWGCSPAVADWLNGAAASTALPLDRKRLACAPGDPGRRPVGGGGD